jgi:hypothetical protein
LQLLRFDRIPFFGCVGLLICSALSGSMAGDIYDRSAAFDYHKWKGNLSTDPTPTNKLGINKDFFFEYLNVDSHRTSNLGFPLDKKKSLL